MLTDDIRTQAAAISASVSAIVNAANAIDALPSGGGTQQTWPTPIDCLGGTNPPAITIPVGDGAPTGQMGEPGYSRKLANRPDGCVYIFGDSIIQASTEGSIHLAGANYALGGQSLRRLINSLDGFRTSLQYAGAGVILCGVNDLGNTTYYGPRTNGQAVVTVLGMFSNQLKNWLTGKWVICHLLPTRAGVADAVDYKSQVDAVNAGLAGALSGCAAQIAFCPVNPEMIDAAGYLKPECTLADGQHLSKLGSSLLGAGISAALASLGV